MVEEVLVACGGCTLCCRNDRIVLMPEDGDDVSSYQCHEETVGRARSSVQNPMKAMILDHRENGDCVYLGEHGCQIHERRPWICRVFSCIEVADHMDALPAAIRERIELDDKRGVIARGREMRDKR